MQTFRTAFDPLIGHIYQFVSILVIFPFSRNTVRKKKLNLKKKVAYLIKSKQEQQILKNEANVDV